MSPNQQKYMERTRIAYVATRVMDTPFWAIYNMLQVILYKDLHASAFQITVMIALKPLVSLISMYWSSAVNKRRDRLVSNIIWARILGYLPFFFFPFIDNPWFFIFSFGLYMMLALGIVPAWMEILKLNIPGRSRERVFSYTQAFGYMGGGLLPFVLGWTLDGYFQSWRWVFPITASLALTSLYFQFRILIPNEKSPQPSESRPIFSHIAYLLTKPWKTAWELVSQREDFRNFQIGSMITGCALMIIQPASLFFFVDVLKLSYTELAIAFTLCKGLGFAITSPLWPRLMNQMDIYRLSSLVAALGCLFPICLILANWHLVWLYFGYICYGIMQSGNELIWNMSGPLFARDRDSSVFTSVSVLAAGLRGCCIPACGSFLAVSLGAPAVICISGFLYILAAFRLWDYAKQSKTFGFNT